MASVEQHYERVLADVFRFFGGTITAPKLRVLPYEWLNRGVFVATGAR